MTKEEVERPYWLCCGSNDPKHREGNCWERELYLGHPERIRWGTKSEHAHRPNPEPFLWWNPTDERALPPELVKHADHPEDFTVPLYAHPGPSADVDEAREIIKGFLTCPEIAECDAQDRDVETTMIESRAHDYLARARSGKG